MSTNIRKFAPQSTATASAGQAEVWNEAEEYLFRQMWPNEPRGAYEAPGSGPQAGAALVNGLTDSIAVRRATTSARVRKQTVPVVHALQHLCEMMSGILEETSLESLVLNGAIKPQEAIMLREAVQWLDRKMTPTAH